jgi:hypothetical protein
MNYPYLSIISSTFIIIGYLPEIYLTIFQIKNVDSTKYSSTLWLFGGVLGTVYSGINNADTFITANYSINTSLNLLTLILKIYYYCKIRDSFNSINNESNECNECNEDIEMGIES